MKACTATKVVGGVIGTLATIIIVVVTLFLCICRRKQGHHPSLDILAQLLSPLDYPNASQKSRFFTVRQFVSPSRSQKWNELLCLPSSQSLTKTFQDAGSEEGIPP
ncbi:hypothetical protein PM082_012560 [Marasmius tenuissimus]|nr:hypothetical protein PM082_012560 [Marasmius tenuissimus]